MILRDSDLKAENNNIGITRLILASAVIWTHSYWAVHHVSGQDEFSLLLGTQPVSAFAVNGFFFMSGFLVYASLARRSSVVQYALRRLLRIWPALATCVTLTAVIGAYFSQASGTAYWLGETFRFLVGNMSLLTAKYSLTGVMCDGALCNVNGSLWTIPWEVRCYIVLGVLALLGLTRPALMGRLILPLTLATTILWRIPGVQDWIASHLGQGVTFNLAMFDRLWSMFALGIAAYLVRERLVLNWWICALLFAATVAEAHWQVNVHAATLFTGYAVLCCAFLTSQKRSLSGKWPDYSYGMYLYAFPVMMLLVQSGLIADSRLLALANATLTLPLAALSWHFIEKPAMGLIRRMKRQPAPVAVH
jgi:peptidoglycan/LPS O-acetylase OafA/YrhL